MRTIRIGSLAVGVAAAVALSGVPAAGSPGQAPAFSVSSAGIADVTPVGAPAIAMVHVRVVITNRDADASWRFDARSTWIEVGELALRTVVANADAGTLPVVRVDPGDVAVVDLFAPLPAQITSVDRVIVRTRVASPDRTESIRARYLIGGPERVAPAVSGIGGGSTWWVRRSYVWASYHRGSGPITPRAPAIAGVALRAR